MPFTCTLSDETEFLHTKRGNSHALVAPVGFDEELDTDYSLVAGLDPMPGGDMEFYFYLIAHCQETGETSEYRSGRDVARLIDAADRARILMLLLSFTSELIAIAKPESVLMVTIDENPPAKSLQKNAAIVRVFEANGYKIVTTDPYHGQQVWRMERGA